MAIIRDDYPQRVYAGWLGKTIGVRLGAPIESMTHEKIMDHFQHIDGYLIDYDFFAADDDSNGPIYLVRALEDSCAGHDMQPQDVAEALLNYAPYEHGFFWWGGYGISTEHTAYLNLRRGIKAPESGSIETNGSTVAEQIGGQIFSDCWGLVCPGDAEGAASLAQKASSVTHDGNAMYGGRFLAAAISLAFVEKDIETIIEKALLQIPRDCEYARVSRHIIDFYHNNPDDWKACFREIKANFGYDKYPGACHVIPNAAVMILSMLYGKGSFDKTIEICCMCGWDTDCNAGNVGTVLGVLCGLEGISYPKWRKDINDFLACSGVMGSMNLTDVAAGAYYMARLGYDLAGLEYPEKYRPALGSPDQCWFAFPGSTQGMRVRANPTAAFPYKTHCALMNTDETAQSCGRALKLFCCRVTKGQTIDLYKRCYLHPSDFSDSRYDPSFSPILYPGERIKGAVLAPEYAESFDACMYVLCRSGKRFLSPVTRCEKGQWQELSLDIPAGDELIEEAGYRFVVDGVDTDKAELCVIVDRLLTENRPDYSINLKNETVEYWKPTHREISQFTQLKGKARLINGSMYLACEDYEQVYTGKHSWEDYTATITLIPETGYSHKLLFRVQGAIRSYAFGFDGKGRATLLKNLHGEQTLQSCSFNFEHGRSYTIGVRVQGCRIICFIDGKELFDFTDEDSPLLRGAIGAAVADGSSCSIDAFTVKAI